MLEPFFRWAEGIGLSLDKGLFERFAADLYTYNEGKNLTRVPPEQAWHRHFADSLLFQDLIPQSAEVADLGTGPGFPAWPLACARPDLQVTAIDSNGKMLDFLRRHPLPNLILRQVRVEEWGVREGFDVVTGRAVAPLAIQLELSAPICRVGGWVLPMRTPNDEPQQTASTKLGLRLVGAIDRETPGGDARRCPSYEKIAKTDSRFPRRWSEIKKQPL